MSIMTIKHGAYAGVAGGIPFGMMMGMMGMLPMIGMMMGSSSAVAGFGVHIGISAVIGIGFAIVFGRVVSGTIGTIGAGMAYGAAWWLQRAASSLARDEGLTEFVGADPQRAPEATTCFPGVLSR